MEESLFLTELRDALTHDNADKVQSLWQVRNDKLTRTEAELVLLELQTTTYNDTAQKLLELFTMKCVGFIDPNWDQTKKLIKIKNTLKIRVPTRRMTPEEEDAFTYKILQTSIIERDE